MSADRQQIALQDDVSEAEVTRGADRARSTGAELMQQFSAQPSTNSQSSSSLEGSSKSLRDNGKGVMLSEDGRPAPLSSQAAEQQTLTDLFACCRRRHRIDLDTVATQPSVFDDEEKAKCFTIHPEWENRHRFDTSLRWTWREERAVVRKLDFRITLWAFLMFFCLDLDRENIAQANSDHLLQDLGLTTNDFNLGNTLYKVAFLCAELPSQMISKRLGVDWWVPTQLVVMSIFSAAQFWMKGRASFLALRWLIGMIQGGFVPDMVLYLSYFYTSRELPLRLMFFWISNYVTRIISPFLALGILRLRGHEGHAGWQYLFLFEGLFTLLVGAASFFQMPAGPCETKNWLYRKPWFTPREEAIIVTRTLRDDPSKSQMHNRQGINWPDFKRSVLDYDLWPLYFIAILYLIPNYVLRNYLTIQLKAFGFNTAQTNALSIPAAALGLVMLIVITVVSDRVNNRTFVAISMPFWNMVCYFALYALPADASRWSFFALATVQQGTPYVHALCVAWVSRQSGSIRTRTISAAIFNMMVQLGAVIAANMYRKDDAPRYRRGNLAIALIALITCLCLVGTFFYYRGKNKKRQGVWSAMSKDEQVEYLRTHENEGNRSLAFRFQL